MVAAACDVANMGAAAARQRVAMQARMACAEPAPPGQVPRSLLQAGLPAVEAGHGERRLLLAVLEDGVRTAIKYAGATRGKPGILLREALAWLASDARDDCFRFARICEALDIDAGRLRGRVLARVRAGAQPGQLH